MRASYLFAIKKYRSEAVKGLYVLDRLEGISVFRFMYISVF